MKPGKADDLLVILIIFSAVTLAYNNLMIPYEKYYGISILLINYLLACIFAVLLGLYCKRKRHRGICID